MLLNLGASLKDTGVAKDTTRLVPNHSQLSYDVHGQLKVQFLGAFIRTAISHTGSTRTRLTCWPPPCFSLPASLRTSLTRFPPGWSWYVVLTVVKLLLTSGALGSTQETRGRVALAS